MSNPIRDRIIDAIAHGADLEVEELADCIMPIANDMQVTVTLSLVSRVMALEEALRRLADAAYPVVDHERAYGPMTTEVVLQGRRIGPDDGVYPLTVGHLRELAEATEQAEQAFWPTESIDLAPELLDAR